MVNIRYQKELKKKLNENPLIKACLCGDLYTSIRRSYWGYKNYNKCSKCRRYEKLAIEYNKRKNDERRKHSTTGSTNIS
jgi:hypothetical protein